MTALLSFEFSIHQQLFFILALVAGLMALSFVFLAYSAYVVPMQLSFWANRDPCDPFPTLYFDLVVDTYFLVISPLYGEQTQQRSVVMKGEQSVNLPNTILWSTLTPTASWIEHCGDGRSRSFSTSSSAFTTADAMRTTSVSLHGGTS